MLKTTREELTPTAGHRERAHLCAPGQGRRNHGSEASRSLLRERACGTLIERAGPTSPVAGRL
jgi:hypothetical protein